MLRREQVVVSVWISPPLWSVRPYLALAREGRGVEARAALEQHVDLLAFPGLGRAAASVKLQQEGPRVQIIEVDRPLGPGRHCSPHHTVP